MTPNQRRVDRLTREAHSLVEQAINLGRLAPSWAHPIARIRAIRRRNELLTRARRLVELAEQVPR